MRHAARQREQLERYRLGPERYPRPEHGWGKPPEKVESFPEPEDVSDIKNMSTAELHAFLARSRVKRSAALAAQEEAAASTEAGASSEDSDVVAV